MNTSFGFALVLCAGINNLDNPDYYVRESASASLDRLGFRAVPALWRVCATTTSPEVRMRVSRILGRRNGEYIMFRRQFPAWEAWAFYGNTDLYVGEVYTEYVKETPGFRQWLVFFGTFYGYLRDSDVEITRSLQDPAEPDTGEEGYCYSLETALSILRYRANNQKHFEDTSDWEPRRKKKD